MSWIGRVLCLALVSVFVFASPSAGAQAKEKQTIQVLTVFSNTAYDQAEALSIALKRAVDRSGRWSLGKGDFSLEVLTAALGCKEQPDAACLKKIAEQVKTDTFVWGSIEKQGADVVGTLHLYEAGPGKQTSVRYAENLSDASDETLLQIAAAAFAELTGTAPGKLVIISKNAKTVRIDDEAPRPLNAGRNELELAGGEHKLTFSAPGFGDETREVAIVSGESMELELALTPTAAQVSAGGSIGPDGGPAMSTRKVVGIGAMGLGGVLLAGAVYSALKVNGINRDEGFDRYRASVGEGEDVCDTADSGRSFAGAPAPGEISDQCSTASTFQTLQWIFAGAGVLAGGVGAYLFFTDDAKQDSAKPSRPSRPRVDTQVASNGGFVRLSLQF